MSKEKIREFEVVEDDLKKCVLDFLRSKINDSGLTQRQVAEKLCTTQPRISHMLNGDTSGFTLSYRLRCVFVFDYDVSYTYKPEDENNPLIIQFVKSDVIQAMV